MASKFAVVVSGSLTFAFEIFEAPVISAIEALDVTDESATAVWNTDIEASSQIEYGETTAYGSTTTLDETEVTAHSQQITGLSADTVYHYRVVSIANGQTVYSADQTFETQDTGLNPACVISDVTEHAITSSSAQITWTTDIAATSQIEYGETDEYGSATVLDTDLDTSHSQVISGLDAETTYHYRVVSVANGITTNGDDGTFETLAVPVGDPDLPQAAIDTTYSLPTGGTTYKAYGDEGADEEYTISLLDALAACTRGDVIILKAGSTYTGNYTLPSKAGAGWIYIISSDLASLPAGTRVTADDVSHMATIRDTSGVKALYFPMQSCYYRLAGLEICTTHSSSSTPDYDIIRFGNTTTGYDPETSDIFPNNVTFDRCYIHGTTTGNVIDAINASWITRFAIVDSLISEIHSTSESHGIELVNGLGPHKIHNTRIEAAGIVVFIGTGGRGLDVAWNPSDITISRNYLYKSLTWNSADPSYGGISWKVKNILEFKAGTRVLCEGNEFVNNWLKDQAGGFAVLVTPRFYPVSDITFRRNYLHNVWSGMLITPAELALSDVLVEDNVFAGMTYRWSEMGWSAGGSTNRVAIRHNTLLGCATGLIWFTSTSAAVAVEDFIFQDNIFRNGSYGISGSGYPVLKAALDRYCTTYLVDTNLSIRTSGTYAENPPTIQNFFYETGNAGVGFTDTTLDTIDDFALLNTSDYYAGAANDATDGKDLGADIAAIQAAMAGT